MNRSGFETWLKQPAPERRPLVMGVVNLTPDSFSDGGTLANLTDAIAHVRELIDAGADLLDIGGESTRPGSIPTPAATQLARVEPVLRGLDEAKLNESVVISIDTTHSVVARRAIELGTSIVNDISAGRDDPEMLPLVAESGVSVVLMHMQGQPATMQDNPTYGDIVSEVRDFLTDRVAAAARAGVRSQNIILDPGIGFGKNVEHNLRLLAASKELAEKLAPHPLLIGASRKGFIGKITLEPLAKRRLFGTAATVAWCVANGAGIVRVHDVKAMKQVLDMTRAIADELRMS